MPENTDPITLTLDTLRSDVERNPLADSQTVRRRGDRRTRNQALAGAVVVVALVVGVAGLSGGVGGDSRRTAPPASPTPEPTQTTRSLAPDPFLQPTDIATVGPYKGLQPNPDASAADQQLSTCVPRLSTLGARVTKGRFYFSDLDATATEHVLRFASAEEATGAVATLEDAFATCPEGDPAEVVVEDRPPVPVAGVSGADTALQASRTGTPVQASEVSYFELGVAREANVVVVLQWHSMGQPPGVDWVWDANRMASALDRAVD
jgi:hypothetical protein